MSARHPLDADGVVALAVLDRGGFPESVHLGAAVVTGPDGAVLRELGDGDADVLGRSSLKLFQAIAVRRAGVPLVGEQLALAAASHAGTEDHVRVALGILAAADVAVEALQCPADWPLDRASAAAERAAGAGPRRITMNCSGKHAAFLAACTANGWSLDDYLAPDHPLQRGIRSTIEEFTGDEVRATVIDGCGAPVFATSLAGLARATGRVSGAAVNNGDADAAALVAAILAHPWAIDGPGRENTIVIERLGIVAKRGAEGVMVMGTAEGTGVAVKVVDGGLRAGTLVALELLASVGAVDREAAERVIADTSPPVLGGGVPVGALRASELVLGR